MNPQTDETRNTLEPFDQGTQVHAPYGGYRRMRTGGWVGGAVLIVLGVLLLAQNYGFLPLANSWALFILIPAVAVFGRGLSLLQASGGRLNSAVRSKLFSGVILALLSGMFLFRMNIFIIGPVLLVVFGAGLLVNSLLPE